MGPLTIGLRGVKIGAEGTSLRLPSFIIVNSADATSFLLINGVDFLIL